MGGYLESTVAGGKAGKPHNSPTRAVAAWPAYVESPAKSMFNPLSCTASFFG
jgi:hypothetical protein